MALIKCPECGNMVSDKAINCINCGAPLPHLIKCEECGTMFDVNTQICPNCGFPTKQSVEQKIVDKYVNEAIEEQPRNTTARWLFVLIGILAVTICVLGMFALKKCAKKGSDDYSTESGIDRDSSQITEGKYYVILYKDNTGGFYAPNGGRICGLKAPEGRQEPITLRLSGDYIIMGNNSDDLYVTNDRVFSDYSDYLRYNSKYNPDLTLGSKAERHEQDGSLVITFDFDEDQIEKFDIPSVLIEKNNNNEYTLVYYSDKTGDLFDSDASHICGLKEGFSVGEFSFRLSKTETLFGISTDKIVIDKGKVYATENDFSDDRYAFKQTKSKAKTTAKVEDIGNAVIFHFSKIASDQGMVGTASLSSAENYYDSVSSSTSSTRTQNTSEDAKWQRWLQGKWVRVDIDPTMIELVYYVYTFRGKGYNFTYGSEYTYNPSYEFYDYKVKGDLIYADDKPFLRIDKTGERLIDYNDSKKVYTKDR